MPVWSLIEEQKAPIYIGNFLPIVSLVAALECSLDGWDVGVTGAGTMLPGEVATFVSAGHHVAAADRGVSTSWASHRDLPPGLHRRARRTHGAGAPASVPGGSRSDDPDALARCGAPSRGGGSPRGHLAAGSGASGDWGGAGCRTG